MLRADVIVGALWGDEGKGKLVGTVGHDYDAVLRVNASTNAGHSVNDGKATYVTRQLPSVFFPKRTQLVIAPGALLNLVALADEVQTRPDLPELRGKLAIASSVALLIEPYIVKGQGGRSRLLGSTHQGTGPAAVARTARHALHLYDIQAAARGGERQRAAVTDKLRETCRETLPELYGEPRPDHAGYFARLLDQQLEAWRLVCGTLGDVAVDYTAFLLEMRRRGQRLLVEGCNGLLLDNLHGALPFVTSASTNVGAMICGANLSPGDVERVTVVMAAYSTCLGKRPFPTEMSAEEAAPIMARCDEVDVAVGQPRRLGWVDLPALRKALAGCPEAVLHLNKLDALGGSSRLRIATHYLVDGEELEVMPDDPELVARAVPRFLELSGFSRELRGVRRYGELPEAARGYLRALQERLPCRIASVGTGPANDELVAVDA